MLATQVGLSIQILSPESVAHLEVAKESDIQVRRCLLDMIRISSLHLHGGIDSRIPKNIMFQFLAGNDVTFVYTWPDPPVHLKSSSDDILRSELSTITTNTQDNPRKKKGLLYVAHCFIGFSE